MDFLEEFKKGIEEIAHSNDLEKENKELKQQLADSKKVIEAFEMKEQYLKNYYHFTDEQCKMHDLFTQLWHLTYLSNKQFAEVLRRILNEVENV